MTTHRGTSGLRVPVTTPAAITAAVVTIIILAIAIYGGTA